MMISLIIIGALLFGVVTYVVMRATRTVSAVVPNVEIPAGQMIDISMLSVIQVPVNTPQGYITDRTSLVGQKLKINATPGQFLYMSDVMFSWNDVLYGVSVPDDYVITAISVPDSHAVGGTITAGDVVDILAVPNKIGIKLDDSTDAIKRKRILIPEETPTIAETLGNISGAYYTTSPDLEMFWALANVQILETDSTMSNENNNVLSSIIGDSNNGNGAYYIVALSYVDYQRLMYISKYADLYFNIASRWRGEDIITYDEEGREVVNKVDSSTLLRYMQFGEQWDGLHDAQAQSVLEEYLSEQEQPHKRINQETLDRIEKAEEEWIKKQEEIAKDPSKRYGQSAHSGSVITPDAAGISGGQLQDGQRVDPDGHISGPGTIGYIPPSIG